MGSTKHIRNNGEHLNIHGHDNYQMPGAYKQMGDQNQNQSIGAYKLVGDQEMMQPSKISGGAAKYIKEASNQSLSKSARKHYAENAQAGSKSDSKGGSWISKHMS